MAPSASTRVRWSESRADAAVAALGDRVQVHDLYSHDGAPVYHDIAGHDTHEVREILASVARHRGEILDLAAGSGRITMPLLATGRTVTAVDLSGSMLRLLTERLAVAPASWRDRCTALQADMRTFELGRRFAAVVLGTTSISLLDPQGRGLLAERVRRHLAPGGTFVVSTVELDRAAAGPGQIEHAVRGAGGTTYRVFESVDPDGAHRRITIVPDPREGDDSQHVIVCTSTIALLPADDLIRELADAGYTLRRRRPVSGLSGRLRGTLLELAVTA